MFAVASGTEEPKIPQWYYYTHTPGHNPLLVNRFIEPLEMGITSQSAVRRGDEESLFQLNLQPKRRPAGTSLQFHTTSHDPTATDLWQITMPPETQRNLKWSLKYQNNKPVAWLKEAHDSAYWIVRCPKEIIAGRNDIWSRQAMEMYAALYAIAVELAHRRP